MSQKSSEQQTSCLNHQLLRAIHMNRQNKRFT